MEELVLGIGGSNPIEVWCINRPDIEISCSYSNSRTPGSVTGINLSLSHRRSINLTTWHSTCDHQQPKSLRAGLGWCVVSVPLPSGPNTGSNPGEGRVQKKSQNKIFWKLDTQTFQNLSRARKDWFKSWIIQPWWLSGLRHWCKFKWQSVLYRSGSISIGGMYFMWELVD